MVTFKIKQKYAFSAPIVITIIDRNFSKYSPIKMMKLYGNKHVPRPEAEVFSYKLFRSVRALTQSSLIYTAQHSLDPPSDKCQIKD